MLKPIFIPYGGVLKKIDLHEVAFFCTRGNYTHIVLADKTSYEIRASLAKVLEKLPADVFCQIHRAFVVSIYFIEHIYKDYLVTVADNLPISRQYHKGFMEWLNRLR